MTFFKQKNLQSRKIEINTDSISSGSPQVQQRLDRIHENYRQLDSILAEIETKIQNDERLRAIDQSIKEVEIARKKKKWRPRKAAKSKSINPKKPR